MVCSRVFGGAGKTTLGDARAPSAVSRGKMHQSNYIHSVTRICEYIHTYIHTTLKK